MGLREELKTDMQNFKNDTIKMGEYIDRYVKLKELIAEKERELHEIRMMEMKELMEFYDKKLEKENERKI